MSGKAKLDKCFRHPRRKAAFKWRVCSDGPWRGVCRDCDLDLNKMGLKWAFPKMWKKLYAAYEKEMRS